MDTFATSPDLFSNKDILLSISTFLSLKQLNLLREISKQFKSWLSDFSSFSWKKRIELSFPASFKDVLKEDVKDQMAKLRKFDTLVDSGHQVSFFLLSSLLDAATVAANMKYQVPWARHQYLITYNQTEALVFDSLSGRSVSRVNFPEMISIETVLFDIKHRKVGFVNRENGTMTLCHLENNELKFDAYFMSNYLKFQKGCELIKQIYGDNIIVHGDYQLVWYSLLTNEPVKQIDLTFYGVYVVASEVEPVLFVSETDNDTAEFYTIHVVDCTLQSTEPMTKLYSANLEIEYENCGDGVNGLELIETEHGRMLNIYQLGTCDRAYDAYDICTDRIVDWLHFDYSWRGYRSIRYNPGSNFYSVKKGSQLAIMETDEEYQDDVCDSVATIKTDDDELSEEEDYYNGSEDPLQGAYFKFNSKTEGSKWLNKDLFAVKTLDKVNKKVEPEPLPSKARRGSKRGRLQSRVKVEPEVAETKSRLAFFSIAKRGIIGSIDDDINEVFIADNTIIAFTAADDIYRVILDMDFQDKDKDEKNEDENVADVKNEDRQVEEEGSGANNKRKISERDDDDSDDVQEPPKKKQRMECCCS